MNIKNWIKTLVSASMLWGIGHCCRHYNVLNIRDLRFSQSANTVTASATTPSVLGDSTAMLINALPQKEGYTELNWELLAKTQFKPISVDSLDGLIVLFPTFPKIMTALEGKKVMIQGYVIPIEEMGDTQTLVLSANSYTTCFFCGKAEPESVMDIRLKNPKKLGRFKQDQKVAFKGRLVLNESDYMYFNYIMEDAETIK